MKSIALQMLAEINPDTPEFDSLPGEVEVSFTPLETVWADDRADFGRKVAKSAVVSGYTRFRPGDVLCPKVTPTFQAGRSMIAREVGAGTTELHVLRPRPHVDGRFVCYAVRSKGFLDEGVTAFQGVAGLQRVPSEFIRSFKVVDCDAQEQRRIADFLDDRVSRIDNIISARRRQIALAGERLRTEIDSSVSHDTAHPVRASHLLRVLPGFAFASSEFSSDPDNVRLLRGVNVSVGETRWDEIVHWPKSRLNEVTSFILSEGDLVMGMDRPWIGAGLRIAVLGYDDVPALLLQRVAKLISGPRLRSRFAFWVYQASTFREKVENELTGLSVPHLSGEQIGAFRVPHIDLHAQDRIIGRLDTLDAAVKELSLDPPTDFVFL